MAEKDKNVSIQTRTRVLLRHFSLFSPFTLHDCSLSSSHVLVSIHANGCGLITLNRPERINALSAEMDEFMCNVLEKWRFDDRVKFVVFCGNGNGFCAGGDLREIVSSREAPEKFFRANYTLNYKIYSYCKPTVALFQGITMGGGVGISFHCTYRVMTSNTIWALPEVSIGMVFNFLSFLFND